MATTTEAPFSRARLDAALAGVGAIPHGDLFAELAAAYDEPTRHYHTRHHIAACLRDLARWHEQAERPNEIALALWFHDAVYDTHRDDNEARSADWAARYLAVARTPRDAIGRIDAMIRATASHVADDPDGGLMQDIDLAILAAAPGTFAAYDRAIRAEYAWIPEARYRERRRQVLASILERATIYRTAPLRERYERRARGNLKGLIEKLS
jgi:predicted metal-dependent HD superfamily phosphohydrolase